MSGCFAQDGFAQRDFVQGCPADAGLASSILDLRIPRWLLKFERLGRITYLSDVGGEVEGIFYVPAVVDVQHSELIIDLERFSIPRPSATVHISPSALHEHFLDINELGQAKVTVSSWDGHKARPIITADMQSPEWGYDGEPTAFRLVEAFRHDPHFPTTVVDLDGFTKASLIEGARFRTYTQVWGTVTKVPAFALMIGDTGTRYMSAGHDSPTLPFGNNRYVDLAGRTYIGFESVDPPPGDLGVDWSNAQGITDAGALIRIFIEKYGQYNDDELNKGRLEELYGYLRQFSVGGFTNSEGPLFSSLIAQRFQPEYLFVMWEEAGLLTGAAINPTAPPTRILVFGVHLLQLDDTVKEEPRYTRFKIRYHYSTEGWFKVTLDDRNSDYLKEAHQRWGGRTFGDPVDVPIHNNSVDLADVWNDGSAKNVMMRYAQLFHRGQRAKYLQLAEFAEIPLGQVVALVDPERDYDEKPAILIGRNWVTPELVQLTYRTIEPFEIVEPKKVTASGSGGFTVYCFPDFTIDPTGPVLVGPGTGASTCECSLLIPEGGAWVQWGVETFTRHGDPAGGAGAFATLRIYDDDTCGSFTDDGTVNAGGSGGFTNHCWHDENRGKTFVAGGKRVGLVMTLFVSNLLAGDRSSAIPKLQVLASEPADFAGYSIDLGPCS